MKRKAIRLTKFASELFENREPVTYHRRENQLLPADGERLKLSQRSLEGRKLTRRSKKIEVVD